MIISVELLVPRRRTSLRQVLVRTAGSTLEVPLHTVPDVLHGLADAAEARPLRGLHPVDADEPASSRMDDDTLLRLVIDLIVDEAGTTTLNMRRLDRPVDYGPLSVGDLPYVIEALLQPVAAVGEDAG